MRLTSVLLATACAHSPDSGQELTIPDGSRRSHDPNSSEVRPLTFASACVPKVLRLPVRADIEPGRTPNVDQLVFLKPVCIADQGKASCRVGPDVLYVDQSKRAFHGEGVAVLSVMYVPHDPPKLTVSLESLDETTLLADALAITETAAVIEDGCVARRRLPGLRRRLHDRDPTPRLQLTRYENPDGLVVAVPLRSMLRAPAWC